MANIEKCLKLKSIDGIYNLSTYYHYEQEKGLEDLSLVPQLQEGQSYETMSPVHLARQIQISESDHPIPLYVPRNWSILVSQKNSQIPSSQGQELTALLDAIHIPHIRFKTVDNLVHGELITCMILFLP